MPHGTACSSNNEKALEGSSPQNENGGTELHTEMSPEQKKFLEKEKLRLAALESFKKKFTSMYCGHEDIFCQCTACIEKSEPKLDIAIDSVNDIRKFLKIPAKTLNTLVSLQFKGSDFFKSSIVSLSELSSSEFKAFCQQFSYCIQLKIFSLNNFYIPDVSGWERMGIALAELSNLRKLSVRRCLLSPTDDDSPMDSLNDACYDAILKLQDLETLDFSENPIAGKEGLKRLLPLLPKLRQLILQNICYDYAGYWRDVQNFYDAIAGCPQLDAFDFSGNYRRRKIFEGLTEAIRKLTQLKSLRLVRVLPFNGTAATLWSFLSAVNIGLESLDFSHNLTNDEKHLAPIGNVISRLPNLRKLAFRDCDYNFKPWCQFISKCQQLESLDVFGNTFVCEDSYKYLSEMFLKLPKLRKLSLNVDFSKSSDHPEKFKPFFEALLKSSRALNTLYLGCQNGTDAIETLCSTVQQFPELLRIKILSLEGSYHSRLTDMTDRNQSKIIHAYIENFCQLMKVSGIPTALQNLIWGYLIGISDIESPVVFHTAFENKIPAETDVIKFDSPVEKKCTTEEATIIHTVMADPEVQALEQKVLDEYNTIFFHTLSEIPAANSTSPTLTYAYPRNGASSLSSSYLSRPISAITTGTSSNTNATNSSILNTVTPEPTTATDTDKPLSIHARRPAQQSS